MQALADKPTGAQRQAGALFAQSLNALHRRADRIFAALMIVQWIAGIAAAVWISPRTWIGAEHQTHWHVWAAIFMGGMLTSLPVYLAWAMPGRPLTRQTIAVAQTLFSALLIHLTGGRIETHFHVFCSLALLAFYRDWRVLATATIVVAVDHAARGVFFPQSVFGILTASPWRWIEHAGWVLFEDFFLFISIEQGMREMREVARRRAELEESESRFRSVTQSVGDAIISADSAGEIIFWNHGARNIFGYLEAETLGQPLSIIMPERFREMHRRGIARFLATGEKHVIGKTVELVGLHKDAHEFPIDLTFSTWEGSDGTFFTSIVRDITARKLAEDTLLEAKQESERANHAKSDFLSRMSHELRTPMNAILGFGQLLELERDLPPDHRESVDQILKGGRHLLDLINEVLDISTIEAGRMTLSLEPVTLHEVLCESLDLVRPLADIFRIKLDHTALHSCDGEVMADRQRLKQVTLNLLSNAIKYNCAGGIVKIVCAEIYAEGVPTVRVEISDTGRGIAPENLKKLFVPFERMGAERTNVEGTGLGLALTKRFVELMGGTLGVNSVLGEGSTFWIELPRVEAIAESREQADVISHR